MSKQKSKVKSAFKAWFAKQYPDPKIDYQEAVKNVQEAEEALIQAQKRLDKCNHYAEAHRFALYGYTIGIDTEKGRNAK